MEAPTVQKIHLEHGNQAVAPKFRMPKSDAVTVISTLQKSNVVGKFMIISSNELIWHLASSFHQSPYNILARPEKVPNWSIQFTGADMKKVTILQS